jgi:hypothetical protein
MVRSNREGVSTERWEKYGWNEAELRFIVEHEAGQGPYLDNYLRNSRFAVGEVVQDRKFKHRGVVVEHFLNRGLYVMFPQYDTPQLVQAVHMEKIDED